MFDGIKYVSDKGHTEWQTPNLPKGLAITVVFSLIGLVAFALNAISDPGFATIVATTLAV